MRMAQSETSLAYCPVREEYLRYVACQGCKSVNIFGQQCLSLMCCVYEAAVKAIASSSAVIPL